MAEAHDSPQPVHITFVQTALECSYVHFILERSWMLSKRTVKIVVQENSQDNYLDLR